MNNSLVASLVMLMWVLGAGVPSNSRGEIVVDSALLQLIEEVDVPARTSGVLATVDVIEGSTVELGAPLGQIDSRQAQMLHRRAAIELELSKEESSNDVAIRSAQKALDFARADLSRLERATAGLAGSISKSQIEESRFRVSKAGFEVEAAAHEARLNKLTERLKQQELSLNDYELDVRQIKAPVAGIVVEVQRHAGEWVEPGDKIVRIVRVDRLRAEGLIHSDDVPADWRGLPASVSVTEGSQAERRLPGSVVFVSPEVNPVNGLVRISVDFDNPQSALKPGQRARIWIATPARGAQARLPNGEGNPVGD